MTKKENLNSVSDFLGNRFSYISLLVYEPIAKFDIFDQFVAEKHFQAVLYLDPKRVIANQHIKSRSDQRNKFLYFSSLLYEPSLPDPYASLHPSSSREIQRTFVIEFFKLLTSTEPTENYRDLAI